MLGLGAVFDDAATYNNYTVRLQKVCFYLGDSADWLTPASRHVPDGAKKCHCESFEFPNFTWAVRLLWLIRGVSIQSEFAQSRLFAFLFSFRVPSETTQLRRAYRDDRLTDHPPHLPARPPKMGKASVGPRLVQGHEYMAAKSSPRNNLAPGAILKRPCFRGLGNDAARVTFPAHTLWPSIGARAHPGANFFCAANRRNFNRRMRSIFS